MSAEPLFLNPHAEIAHAVHHLPHWQQGAVCCAVTWRLADSLPVARLSEWRSSRGAWLKYHPQPWSLATESEYYRIFSAQLDRYLDSGKGTCVLRQSACRDEVVSALRYFDGERYLLLAFVVMPNHVHVLFSPAEGRLCRSIVKSWKGFTARKINALRGQTGTLWQEDYWDRLIRNERHFFRALDYIAQNPVNASLREGEFTVWERPGLRGLENPRS